jgi:hypothetical protein
MTSMLQKVKRGDPLVIPAGTFNTFVDAARDFQQRQRDRQREAQRDRVGTGIVLVRNESGADSERFDVLGIEGPIIERVDNEEEFKQRVALRSRVPSAPRPGKFAIMLEPTKDQAIVRACLDGACVVRQGVLVVLVRVAQRECVHVLAEQFHLCVADALRARSSVSCAARSAVRPRR